MSNKDIFDPIHGFISISPLLQLFIDTPEFQRLRDLKQLGATYFVYPSATHTRFEHSIGVCHLAGELLRNLKKNQPTLNIKNNTLELVQIAALVHDIGHGPFSHLYDDYVRQVNEPEHEERGIDIFKQIIKNNNCIKNQLSNENIIFICNLINPPKHLENNWLYQIVCNKVNHIDVDKIDYILRDSYHIGIPLQGEFSRLLSMVKVCNYKNEEVLAWNKKIQYDIFLLFSSRYRLHKQVYTHHTVKSFEHIIIPIIQTLKKQIDFIDFTDSAILCRYNSPCINELNKLNNRDIPILIGEITLTDKAQIDLIIENNIKPDYLNNNPELFIFEILRLGLSSSTNPLENVYYYDKTSNNMAYLLNPSEFSFIVPLNHNELVIRFYVKNRKPNKHVEIGKTIWNKYIEQIQL